MTLHPGTIAAQTPQKIAVIFDDGAQLTYAALDRHSRAIAADLHHRGLRQGDVVAMLVGNRPEFFAVAWAAQRSGLYYLPIPTRLTAAEIAYILDDSGAKAIAIDPDLHDIGVAAIAGLPIDVIGLSADEHDLPEPPATEGSDMLYTSGSTGRPKGVRRAITGQPLGSDKRRVERGHALFGLGGDSVFLTPAPLYHAGPLRFAMNLLRTGGTVVGMRKFSATGALTLIERYRVTHSQWVPTMFVRLLDLPEAERAKYDLGSHRVAIHGAAPCAPDVKRAMIAWWGPIVHEIYAGTESVGFTHVTSEEWLRKPGTVGRAFGSTVHICDDNGAICAPYVVGSVCFTGSEGFSYHNDPEKTASAYDVGGRATIGDIGYLDDDGYLFLTDRRAFTIISGGVNIYPAEVEFAIAAHPDVADVAVFGIADRDLGETVFALVELRADLQGDFARAASIRDFAKNRLAAFKLPKRIAFGEVSRTETGKLLKMKLKTDYSSGARGFIMTRAHDGVAA